MKHSSIEPHLRHLDRLVYDSCDDIKKRKEITVRYDTLWEPQMYYNSAKTAII